MDTSEDEDWSSKCVGTLLGGYIGDSLGAPFEGESSANIQRELPNGPFDFFDQRELTDVKLTAQATGINLGPSRVGEHTDDTECLLSLADSLITMNGLNPHHCALNTALWWARPPSTGGYSAWTFQKLAALARDTDYKQTGTMHGEAGSHGNGGAMRIAPIGLVYKELMNDPKKMREIVTQVLLPTHTHPEAIDAATLLSLAIARVAALKKTKGLRPKSFLNQLASESETEEMKKRLLFLVNHLKDESEMPSEKFDYTQDKVILEQCLTPGKWFQIRAVDAVSSVLWIFCKYGLGFDTSIPNYHLCAENTIARSIAIGGDTDTIACMVGCLLGALYGYKWIPQRWLNNLKDDIVKKIFDVGKKLSKVHSKELVHDVPEKIIQDMKKELKELPIPQRHEFQ